jgi:uncharacterized protein (DUF433 family)
LLRTRFAPRAVNARQDWEGDVPCGKITSSLKASEWGRYSMDKNLREWKYLERRPGSSYKQLAIKGKRIWAWTLYCESMTEKEPRTPQQIAEDWEIPLEAVQEAIAYCQSDPPELHEDQRKDELLAEAIGMKDPAVQHSGKPRPLSTEERARLGL